MKKFLLPGLVLLLTLSGCVSFPEKNQPESRYAIVIVKRGAVMDTSAKAMSKLRLWLRPNNSSPSIPVRVGINFIALPRDGSDLPILEFFANGTSPPTNARYFTKELDWDIKSPDGGGMVFISKILSFWESNGKVLSKVSDLSEKDARAQVKQWASEAKKKNWEIVIQDN